MAEPALEDCRRGAPLLEAEADADEDTGEEVDVPWVRLLLRDATRAMVELERPDICIGGRLIGSSRSFSLIEIVCIIKGRHT